MSGIGFTIGLLCGLLAHLPAETLPAASFESHHLSRVRRVAQVEPSDSSYVPTDLNYMDNLGSVNKQNKNLESTNSDYVDLPVEKQDNQGYEAINSKRPAQYNVLGKYPSVNQDSVVYVNPTEQRLVLDNSVNSVNDSNQPRKPYGSNIHLDDTAISDNNDAFRQAGGHVTAGENGAAGQVDRTAERIEIDNYRKDLTSSGSDVIVNGVFWSNSVEQSCPKGFTTSDEIEWRRKATGEKFLAMNEGCGRMQNRVLTFQISGKACARYRLNVDQIQGEIYSYYLSKLLGINNVPPSVLHLADSNQDQWRMVGEEVANARWSEEKPVILSKWIDGLTPAYIPREFRNLSNVLQPREVSRNTRKLDNKLDNGDTATSLCELLQWSDLIVFDYLTANLDRVVNNLFNLQWNDRMMSKPAHNLERTSSGRLVFLDNESGLFHGYRLLDKYAPYHETLLNSLCIFRKTTIDSIKHLVATDSINDSIQALFESSEPLHRHIPRIPAKNIKILKSRMHAVLRQVTTCESHS